MSERIARILTCVKRSFYKLKLFWEPELLKRIYAKFRLVPRIPSCYFIASPRRENKKRKHTNSQPEFICYDNPLRTIHQRLSQSYFFELLKIFYADFVQPDKNRGLVSAHKRQNCKIRQVHTTDPR